MCTSISGAGIEHDGFSRVGGVVHPAQQLGLAVGLAHHDLQPEFGGLALDERDEIVVAGRAVDLRLPLAEPAEVGAVEHVDGHERTPISE
jgi:hypothetical protein